MVALMLWAVPSGGQTVFPDSYNITRDIAALASDRWEGRLACTKGNDSAVAMIAARFDSLGLLPLTTSNGDRRAQFLDEFSTAPDGRPIEGLAPCRTHNVAGFIRGTDSVLAKEFIVVGAHLDHIGYEARFAADRQRAIHNGADDNASGTAGLLELVRLITAQPVKRSVLFVAFNAEELGLLGSQHFVADRLTFGRIHAMLNFDMIGRMRNDSLFMIGAESGAEFRVLVQRENAANPLKIRFTALEKGSSDHVSFSDAGIPAIQFFTGYHVDYHASTDDAKYINAAGVARIVSFAQGLINRLAELPEPLTAPIRPPRKQ